MTCIQGTYKKIEIQPPQREWKVEHLTVSLVKLSFNESDDILRNNWMVSCLLYWPRVNPNCCIEEHRHIVYGRVPVCVTNQDYK